MYPKYKQVQDNILLFANVYFVILSSVIFGFFAKFKT